MTRAIHREKKVCLVCQGKRLIKYLDLGETALANSYIAAAERGTQEPRFPLRVYYCKDCHLAQLIDVIDRNTLFEDYAYFSSTSPQLEEYFKQYAQNVYDRFPAQTKKITVEIASNDGILLKYFRALGGKILGIDPAKNIVKVARDSGIDTLPLFFNHRTAQDVLAQYGPAGVIIANNVLAHTDQLHSLIAGVKALLDRRGVFIFEVQYLGDLFDQKAFDNTYHEHLCYFSLAPLVRLLSGYDLQIFDIERTPAQGGSIRVYASHAPTLFAEETSVKTLARKEKKQKLHEAKTYKKFGAAPKKIKKDLVTLLKKLKKQGKTIVGYGASAKGNTMLQYCGIGPELIDYIVDTAPSKQGKLTPGSRIPILSPEELRKNPPDYVLLLAWNYTDSIMKKEAWLTERDAKFIKPVPAVIII
jgi:hypothetical protein